jgi:hypothetical protein
VHMRDHGWELAVELLVHQLVSKLPPISTSVSPASQRAIPLGRAAATF